MRKTRIAALGIAAAIVAGALFQLLASPFDRNGHPPQVAPRPSCAATLCTA